MDDQPLQPTSTDTPPLDITPPSEPPVPQPPAPITEVLTPPKPRPSIFSAPEPETPLTSPTTPILPTEAPTPLQTPEAPKEFPWNIVIGLSLFLIVAIAVFLAYRLFSGQMPLSQIQSRPTPTVTPSPTSIVIPTATLRTRTFQNDFIKFEYPENLRQVTVGNDFRFDFYENNTATGSFIHYSMSPLGNLTLENWITRNEKCGTTESRKPISLTSRSGINGFEITDLGACPSGSRVTDAFYFTTGKTVHRLALTTGGITEASQSEKISSNNLINSITLVTETRGVK